jgi:hypothetical protein
MLSKHGNSIGGTKEKVLAGFQKALPPSPPPSHEKDRRYSSQHSSPRLPRKIEAPPLTLPEDDLRFSSQYSSPRLPPRAQAPPPSPPEDDLGFLPDHASHLGSKVTPVLSIDVGGFMGNDSVSLADSIWDSDDSSLGSAHSFCPAVSECLKAGERLDRVAPQIPRRGKTRHKRQTLTSGDGKSKRTDSNEGPEDRSVGIAPSYCSSVSKSLETGRKVGEDDAAPQRPWRERSRHKRQTFVSDDDKSKCNEDREDRSVGSVPSYCSSVSKCLETGRKVGEDDAATQRPRRERTRYKRQTFASGEGKSKCNEGSEDRSVGSVPSYCSLVSKCLETGRKVGEDDAAPQRPRRERTRHKRQTIASDDDKSKCNEGSEDRSVGSVPSYYSSVSKCLETGREAGEDDATPQKPRRERTCHKRQTPLPKRPMRRKSSHVRNLKPSSICPSRTYSDLSGDGSYLSSAGCAY